MVDRATRLVSLKPFKFDLRVCVKQRLSSLREICADLVSLWNSFVVFRFPLRVFFELFEDKIMHWYCHYLRHHETNIFCTASRAFNARIVWSLTATRTTNNARSGSIFIAADISVGGNRLEEGWSFFASQPTVPDSATLVAVQWTHVRKPACCAWHTSYARGKWALPVSPEYQREETSSCADGSTFNISDTDRLRGVRNR